MAWIDQRTKFQKRFDELAQQNTQQLITELNKAVGNFIQKGGISQDPNNNPDYNRILELTDKAEKIKQKYAELNDDILRFVTKEANNNNLAGLLTETGELQKHINKLNKIKDDIKVDVQSAIARDELLRSRNVDISRHQLFVLDRPIRKGLIPYLWVISVLFIGVGLVIFKMTVPQISLGNTEGIATVPMMLLEFISNKVVLGSLLTSAIIVIIFLSLKIAGVFGK
jgi:hypothetical protein